MAKRAGPEGMLQASIIDRLSYDRGVLVLRINAGMQVLGKGKDRRVFRGAKAGTSDLLLCVRCQYETTRNGGAFYVAAGRFCALEVKAPKGKGPTDKQTEFLKRVRELGGFGCVVRSVEEAVSAVWRCREGKSK